MKYMGSKNRIAKEILPIMLEYRTPNQWWIEPFVGGGNMIDKVTGNRLGSDNDKYVIEALIAIRDCLSELPKNNKEFTENDYKQLRQNDNYIYKGYAGYAFSYGGKWLGGWSRTNSTSINQRDYVAESYRNAVNQSPLLQGVKLLTCNYLDLQLPDDSLIYCDPPYEGTTKYKSNFNYPIFWQWCRDMTNKGHTVFISEYNAPDDFECIWQKEIVSSLTKDTGSKTGIEKLFKFKQ